MNYNFFVGRADINLRTIPSIFAWQVLFQDFVRRKRSGAILSRLRKKKKKKLKFRRHEARTSLEMVCKEFVFEIRSFPVSHQYLIGFCFNFRHFFSMNFRVAQFVHFIFCFFHNMNFMLT